MRRTMADRAFRDLPTTQFLSCADDKRTFEWKASPAGGRSEGALGGFLMCRHHSAGLAAEVNIPNVRDKSP